MPVLVFPSCRDFLDLTDKNILRVFIGFFYVGLHRFPLSLEFLEGKQNTSSLPLQTVCYFHLGLNAAGFWDWIPLYVCLLIIVCYV